MNSYINGRIKCISLHSKPFCFVPKPPTHNKPFNTMAKLIFTFALMVAFVAVAFAQGGVKDILGNYYDFTTGQVSSSLTGHVYNTVPAAYPVASYVGGYAHPYISGPAIYGSPFLYK